MRILLVEDDYKLAQDLQQSLRKAGLAVDHVSTGKEAMLALEHPETDAVILELSLPDIDGIEVLKKIRKQKLNVPVIILTVRGSIEHKVMGLDGGADDYLVKPFHMSELLARIRVIERRLGTATTSIIKIGPVELDTVAHSLKVVDHSSELSKKEYMVLKVLMVNAGRILSREQIETHLYDWGEEIASNAIEVHIHNLRKKLPHQFIKTVRGVGYTVKKSDE
ncbi:response regulator [Thalassotalea sp. ND16A]|uniref:response regulator n=1 Tax=Thalassotalea sp. ND16A TaxID=1535422 RepID=UPI000519F11A|nr:response regulator transcription factor [Thalassotalea sp. ND16A]KGJ95684.1 response regulator receiver protein [Thalassotalea sp. ND16A]